MLQFIRVIIYWKSARRDTSTSVYFLSLYDQPKPLKVIKGLVEYVQYLIDMYDLDIATTNTSR